MSNLPFFVLGAAFIVALIAYFRGRTDGAKLERAKQSEAEAEARDVADQVENDVHVLPPDARRRELREWKD